MTGWTTGRPGNRRAGAADRARARGPVRLVPGVRQCLGGEARASVLLLGAQAPARHQQLRLVGRQVSPQDPKSPVRWATAHRAGGARRPTATISVPRAASVLPSPLSASAEFDPGGAGRPVGAPSFSSCMALTRAVIWLFTSTVRGRASMAEASESGVQRSSVDTSSAMDQPA